MRRKRPVNIPWLHGLVLMVVTIALLILTDSVFDGVAELVSGVVVVVGFLIVLRVIAVRGGRASIQPASDEPHELKPKA